MKSGKRKGLDEPAITYVEVVNLRKWTINKYMGLFETNTFSVPVSTWNKLGEVEVLQSIMNKIVQNRYLIYRIRKDER